ncbi:hypothetical protein GGP41_009605 [Bipolaris sorokiniana]|uniref:Uncharacterized protein n=2 Tax=Cochliobolus sativus TaxID=45130 RepID=A0A8H6DRK1_COCSA|nr:hypothetical protein GGP41_009605 [Bipolaris sorokiniana]
MQPPHKRQLKLPFLPESTSASPSNQKRVRHEEPNKLPRRPKESMQTTLNSWQQGSLVTRTASFNQTCIPTMTIEPPYNTKMHTLPDLDKDDFEQALYLGVESVLDDDNSFLDMQDPEPAAEADENSAGHLPIANMSEGDVVAYFEQLRGRVRKSLETEWDEVENFLRMSEETIERDKFKAQFEAFRCEESTISGWNPALIVEPSGDPAHNVHLKLNYPTFRTKRLEYGESADDSNNSTRLLMLKGLNASNALWYESCFRRQAPASSRHQEVATKHWPPNIKELHSSFSQRCESLAKKVLVVFGAPNRKDFNQRRSVTERTVNASPTELVTLGIVRKPNRSIEYLVVYCPHPEWLVWHWTVWAGRYYDACINVAAALGNLNVHPHYFEERARSVKAAATQKIAFRDMDTTRKLEKQNRVRCLPRDLPESALQFAREHEITMGHMVSSFTAGWSVAQLLYDRIQSIRPKASSWNNGVRMPRNLTRNMPAQAPRTATAPQTSSYTTPIKIVPNKTRSKNPILQTAVVHVGRELALMCIRCGATPHSKPIDREPVFVTISAAKGKYVAQRQSCATLSCRPKTRKGQVDQFMVPQDANIPFIRSDNLAKVEVPRGVCKN